MRATTYLLAGWLFIPMLGCANLYDVQYELSQKSRTRSAWRALPERAKANQNYPRDYERGWKDGFYDVTTGGTGCPPVVAPSCYWSPSQILDHCDNRRNEYYSGFQDGAAHASQFPDTHTLRAWGSCDCPLPTCQNCPGTCGCPIGACGLSSASDVYETTNTELKSPADQTVGFQRAEMLESPASKEPLPTAESRSAAAAKVSPAFTSGPPSAFGLVALAGKPVPQQPLVKGEMLPTAEQAVIPSPPPGHALGQSDRAAVVKSAEAFSPIEDNSKSVAAAEESTVKQAKPFVVDEPLTGGTVRLAGEVQLPK